ncbi:MAG TPA: aminotransferase class I/II-fold pyridoxal phosphate-dependent enzyme, partial [Longimicrobiales bacterium]
EICREVQALFMVDMAHVAGLVAGGQHENPVPFAEFVTSTTHKTLRGPRSGFVLCRKAWAAKVNQSVFPGLQGGPLMHVVAAKAIGFGEALQPAFKQYARQIILNAQALAETLMSRGFKLVSGGTDNHLMLVSLLDKGELSGKAAEAALGQANITVNKNTVPGETRSPFVTSGIRIGTAALTTRGMREDSMRSIGGWIADVLDNPADEARIAAVRAQVLDLCASYPIYPEYEKPKTV